MLPGRETPFTADGLEVEAVAVERERRERISPAISGGRSDQHAW
jgi:hypothetical protein